MLLSISAAKIRTSFASETATFTPSVIVTVYVNFPFKTFSTSFAEIKPVRFPSVSYVIGYDLSPIFILAFTILSSDKSDSATEILTLLPETTDAAPATSTVGFKTTPGAPNVPVTLFSDSENGVGVLS